MKIHSKAALMAAMAGAVLLTPQTAMADDFTSEQLSTLIGNNDKPSSPGEDTPGDDDPSEDAPRTPGEDKPGEDTPGTPNEKQPGGSGEGNPSSPGENNPDQPGQPDNPSWICYNILDK